MKRITIIFISVLLIICCCFPVISAGAEENKSTQARDINNYLTIHYDFENCTYSTTDATAVRTVPDIAPVGESEDTLTYATGAGNNCKLTGGDGTVVNTAGNDATITNALALTTAQGNADIKAITGEGTFYMRLKFNQTAVDLTTNRLYFLFGITDGTSTDTKTIPQIWIDGLNDEDTFRAVSVSGAGTRSMSRLPDLKKVLPNAEEYDGSLWVNFFVVFSENDSGSLVRNIYMGVGDDEVPTLISTVDLGSDSLRATGTTTTLRLFGTNNSGRPTEMEVDDFRYYNTDLTNDELEDVVYSLTPEYSCANGVHVEGEQEVTKSASCSEAGSYVVKCIHCGKEIETEEIPMTEHTEGDWIIDKEATQTQMGKRHKECVDCGATVVMASIPKLTVDETEGGATTDTGSADSVQTEVNTETTVSETEVAEEGGCSSSIAGISAVGVILLLSVVMLRKNSCERKSKFN